MSPPERRIRVAALIAVITALLVLAAAASGRLWDLFGPADLGDVDFATLVRRSSPNDALACPPGRCTASSDLEVPEFTVDADALRQGLAAVARSEWRLERIASDDQTRRDRYIQRSTLLGFPDTIVVEFLELPGRRSTLAIYSRSKLGYSDLGANRARIERWLGKLQHRVANNP